MKKLFLVVLTVINLVAVEAQVSQYQAVPDAKWGTQRWNAAWISCPDVSLTDYGVYHFRKTFTLTAKPQTFVINVSADNRYRLFVNGQPVCFGPARGDLNHWYFETVDISSLLKVGENVLAATVWNFGEYIPGAQMTLKTAFIVQGNSENEKVVNTNDSWKVCIDLAYSPLLENRQDVGCGDAVQGTQYPWGWETNGFDDSEWKKARYVGRGQPYGLGSGYDWMLLARDIPLMEEVKQEMKTVRRSENINVPKDFLQGKSKLQIDANKKVSFLIDQTFLTTAYPELTVSGGKGGTIKFTYAEALFDDKGSKANRNEIEGRSLKGYSDIFHPDGAQNRHFRPLWFKTYRYIQVDIQTASEPLTVNSLYGMYTGYPFRENGSFESSDANIKKIWTTGWRTARLCAHETYFDCPYYEQLQYVGDTRIQALISLYVDGDDRLMRKAINMFRWSRSYEGITTSRYPAHTPQYIPPFSLYWINMVHDYWMHRDDEAFVKSCIPTVKTILEWFAEKIDNSTGMLGYVPHWNFQDWPPQWPWDNSLPLGGVPPSSIDGGSAIFTLQFAYTLKDAIELLQTFDEPDLANKYSSLYKTVTEGTMRQCWDENKQMLKDDIKGTSYSQHANIMGILSDAVPTEKQTALFDKINIDNTLLQATFYYRFYLFRAMKKIGKADEYTEMLQPWYDMINIGLTTFAENPEPTRSDCHAWSSSPNYDLLATVCGVEPLSPGFKTVRIAPHPGKLQWIKGTVPHQKGLIKVDLKQTKNGSLQGSVTLPEGLDGVFIWKNSSIQIKSGINEIKF